MKVQTIINGSISILLSPENEMEETILDMLSKQQNDITQIRQQLFVLGHKCSKGILISKTGTQKEGNQIIDDSKKEGM